MNTTVGIYAGSFDPLTYGHIDVIEQGIKLFGHLFIAIGVNHAKKPLFDTSTRINMIQEYLDRAGHFEKATVLSFEREFLVDVAEQVCATHILRGIRSVKDFGDESELKFFNDNYKPEIQTVFVMPTPNVVGISSSTVRGCVGLKNWKSAMSHYTTPYVISKFEELNS